MEKKTIYKLMITIGSILCLSILIPVVATALKEIGIYCLSDLDNAVDLEKLKENTNRIDDVTNSIKNNENSLNNDATINTDTSTPNE